MDDGPDWELLALEVTAFGLKCTAEEVSDPAWCRRKLAIMGIYFQATPLTDETYLAAVNLVGTIPLEHEIVVETRRMIAEAGGTIYTYQLLGGRYKSLGAHNSGLFTTEAEAAAAALWNELRLRAIDWGEEE